MDHGPIRASSSNQYLPKDIVCGVPSGVNRSGEDNSSLYFIFRGSGMIKKKILSSSRFCKLKGILISQALLHVVLLEDGKFK